MRDYGKVHTVVWSSDTFCALNDDGKMLALYLMTSPHSTIAGVFRLPDGYLCEDIGWSPERVAQAFAELLREGFANRCETTKWVWVTKHLQWNPPENPNQRKSAAKVAQGVPDECCWKQEFMQVCGPSLGIGQPQTANPSLTVVKPFPNQEPEQKQEPEQDKPTASSAAKLPPCPHQELIALFGKHLPMLSQPKPELWRGKKADAMRARWVWALTTKSSKTGHLYATDAASALDFFERYFAYVAKSDFLTGRTGAWTGCSLEWLMTEANFAKALEGQYENKAAA
jgi:hypothetical protein